MNMQTFNWIIMGIVWIALFANLMLCWRLKRLNREADDRIAHLEKTLDLSNGTLRDVMELRIELARRLGKDTEKWEKEYSVHESMRLLRQMQRRKG